MNENSKTNVSTRLDDLLTAPPGSLRGDDWAELQRLAREAAPPEPTEPATEPPMREPGEEG